MTPPLDFTAFVETESARFAESIRAADPEARVPSCPDWTAMDLLWHLAEVQLFWGSIVEGRLIDATPALEGNPARPESVESLFSLFDEPTRALLETLHATPDETAVWTWADDQSVGFVRRRQAHEALIHRVDAELLTGTPGYIDGPLAADGVDEALKIMFGGDSDSFHPDGREARIEADDQDVDWTLQLGRHADDDGDGFIVSPPAAAADVSVRGSASELDTWLWGRSSADNLTVEGQRGLFDRLADIVTAGIQ